MPAEPVTPAVTEVVPGTPTTPTTPTNGGNLPIPGTPHQGVNALGDETIPRSIKLKYKLMQWFENQQQCPLNLNGGHPAWIGWKAVTAAAPAVTSPPKGVMGNRTLFVYGFCLKRDNELGRAVNAIQSTDFSCVKTDTEVKARIKATDANTMRIRLDDVWCTLKDISLYRMDDGFTGVRFDFGVCTGESAVGASKAHMPQSASLNMGVSEERTVPTANQTGFSEFFTAVCNGGPPVDFSSINLPKFARGRQNLAQFGQYGKSGIPADERPQPACFAESANTAHVIGKGCYQDFLFFDLEDVNGRLSTIPAQNIGGLNALIPGRQSWWHPVGGVKAVIAPPPAPIAPAPEHINPCAPVNRKLSSPPSQDPCAPQRPTCATYACPPPMVSIPDPVRLLCLSAKGCSKKDIPHCCVMGTTTTTTPIIPEVPGVVVADRVCIFFADCGSCFNYCDCKPKIVNTLTTTTTLPIVEPICEDYPWENLVIGIVSFMLATRICLFIHERCVEPSFKIVKKREKVRKPESTCSDDYDA